MKLIIDRLEEESAIFETDNGSMIHLPKHILEPDCVEGDVYELIFLKSETDKRRGEMRRLKDRLFKKKN